MTDLGPRGARLMASLVVRDPTLSDSRNPMHEVAVSAALAADRTARLEQLAETVEPYIETKGGLATHPVLVEVRQQATLMARLVAALRLPDPRTGKRPQERSLRGVQPSQVSSLERLGSGRRAHEHR